MRYQVTTRLSSQEAIAQAKHYFGTQGVGLDIVDEQETCVTLAGGGGHVSVLASPGEHNTTLELETREWDYAVRQFMRAVA
jgi:hypothetical protein